VSSSAAVVHELTLIASLCVNSRYDQLAVLAPIMLAMTAATPIFKGRLADVDARWNIIAQSVDDRTEAEYGNIPHEDLDQHRRPGTAGESIQRQYKSRYDSISTYIYHCNGEESCKRTFEVYNDIPCPVDEEVKQRLREEGIDENLAHHLAHLFTRDPLVIFEDMIELDDNTRTEHFENIQSTNWNTCRWKPPPPRIHPNDPHIGWRTEFRSMEVQFTDFENAAFTVFIVLITRVILSFDLTLYIPLSKVDENMHRAQQRDAVNSQMFYFRKHLAPLEALRSADDSPTSSSNPIDDDEVINRNNPCHPAFKMEESYEQMSMNEVFNGKSDYFPGLIPLIYAYLDYINCERETYNKINQYLTFISKRATGELITPATWIRRMVASHPAYHQDSIISQEIAYDVLMAATAIGDGSKRCPEILGEAVIEPVRAEDAYEKVLAGRLTSSQRSELLQRLVSRAQRPRQENLPRGQQATLSSSTERPLSQGHAKRETRAAKPCGCGAGEDVKKSEAEK
jgi:glutamate--cysteine ligase catalytic subunit